VYTARLFGREPRNVTRKRAPEATEQLAGEGLQ